MKRKTIPPFGEQGRDPMAGLTGAERLMTVALAIMRIIIEEIEKGAFVCTEQTLAVLRHEVHAFGRQLDALE
jgi:hypothetical protein